jgi:hypothetical protein
MNAAQDSRPSTRFEFSQAEPVRMRVIVVFHDGGSARSEYPNALRIAVDHLAGRLRWEKLFAQGRRYDYRMTVDAFVPGHGDFLIGLAGSECSHQLLDCIFSEQRMVNRVDEKRRFRGNMFERFEKRAKLSLTPCGIDNHTGSAGHGRAHAPRIAAQNNNGNFEPFAVFYRNCERSLAAKYGQGLGKWQMFGTPRGENDGHYFFAEFHQGGCQRISEAA